MAMLATLAILLIYPDQLAHPMSLIHLSHLTHSPDEHEQLEHLKRHP